MREDKFRRVGEHWVAFWRQKPDGVVPARVWPGKLKASVPRSSHPYPRKVPTAGPWPSARPSPVPGLPGASWLEAVRSGCAPAALVASPPLGSLGWRPRLPDSDTARSPLIEPATPPLPLSPSQQRPSPSAPPLWLTLGFCLWLSWCLLALCLSDFLVFPLPLFTVLPFPFLFCLLAKLRIPYYVPRIVLGSGELEVKTRIPAGRTLTGSFFPFSNLHRPLFSFHPTFPLYYHLLFPLPALFLQESFFWRVPG